jgi:polar amino acid transport system substrate-binding protein
MIKRKAFGFIILLICLSMVLLIAGCQSGNSSTGSEPQAGTSKSTLDEILDRGVIRVGIYLQDPPNQFFCEVGGEPAGSRVDSARKLAEDLDVELELIDLEWDATIPSLLSGQVDILWSAHSAYPARALAVDFPGVLATYDQCGMVRKDNEKIKAVSDINQDDVVITVIMGSTHEFFARENFPKATLKPMRLAEARIEVQTGMADVYIGDTYHVAYFADEYPEVDFIRDAQGEPIILSYETGSPCIRQGDPKFFNYIENWLRWYEGLGYFDGLHTKWVEPVLTGEFADPVCYDHR